MCTKRSLSTFAALMAVITLLLSFTSCDLDVENIINMVKHKHEFDGGVIVEQASCSEQGSIRYTCTLEGCDYSYTEAYILEKRDTSDIYNDAVKYVGEITTYKRDGSAFALGTAFVISEDGKIVTNYHVIEGAYSAIIDINGTKYKIASVLACDKDIDLAVLKIEATGLDYAILCKQPCGVGARVYAIGSSRGLTNTYSQGIITYENRVVDGVSHVQHDASITNGNSGGPLINEYGEVIGINTWGVLDSQNLNFAVSVSELDNLVYGKPQSLQKFYMDNIDSMEALVSWLELNATQYTEGAWIYTKRYSGEVWMDVEYIAAIDTLYLSYYDNTKTSDYLAYFVFPETPDGYYEYFWCTTISGQEYVVTGTFKANTYTAEGDLTGYEYTGVGSRENYMVGEAKTMFDHMVRAFKAFLGTSNVGVTLADFGFTSY